MIYRTDNSNWFCATCDAEALNRAVRAGAHTLYAAPDRRYLWCTMYDVDRIRRADALYEQTERDAYEAFAEDAEGIMDGLMEYYEKELTEAEEHRTVRVTGKSVVDADGWWTEYTLYTDGVTWWFVFGDSDLYGPDSWHDWDCLTEGEAYEWFDNYTLEED